MQAIAARHEWSLKYGAVRLYELRDGLDAERIIGSWLASQGYHSQPARPCRGEAPAGGARRN